VVGRIGAMDAGAVMMFEDLFICMSGERRPPAGDKHKLDAFDLWQTHGTDSNFGERVSSRKTAV
jgi:hypothetical protein